MKKILSIIALSLITSITYAKITEIYPNQEYILVQAGDSISIKLPPKTIGHNEKGNAIIRLIPTACELQSQTRLGTSHDSKIKVHEIGIEKLNDSKNSYNKNIDLAGNLGGLGLHQIYRIMNAKPKNYDGTLIFEVQTGAMEIRCWQYPP